MFNTQILFRTRRDSERKKKKKKKKPISQPNKLGFVYKTKISDGLPEDGR